jgi:RNA polymerase sigma factor (TIGR02999 family)
VECLLASQSELNKRYPHRSDTYPVETGQRCSGIGRRDVSGRPGRLYPMSEVTKVLSAIGQGDPRAAEQLLPLVYDELRRLAAQKLAQEKAGQTLQATALVHEAYLRLLDDGERGRDWNGRGHFFAAAAEAMRRILVENARRKRALKRGGDQARVELDSIEIAESDVSDDLLELDAALTQLSVVDPKAAELNQRSPPTVGYCPFAIARPSLRYDPFVELCEVLERLPDHPQDRLAELLPDRCLPPSPPNHPHQWGPSTVGPAAPLWGAPPWRTSPSRYVVFDCDS